MVNNPRQSRKRLRYNARWVSQEEFSGSVKLTMEASENAAKSVLMIINVICCLVVVNIKIIT